MIKKGCKYVVKPQTGGVYVMERRTGRIIDCVYKSTSLFKDMRHYEQRAWFFHVESRLGDMFERAGNNRHIHWLLRQEISRMDI